MKAARGLPAHFGRSMRPLRLHHFTLGVLYLLSGRFAVHDALEELGDLPDPEVKAILDTWTRQQAIAMWMGRILAWAALLLLCGAFLRWCLAP